jgi:acetophenone carboxylase
VYSADIDVGGTLTDGIFSDGQRIICAKVDTTAHDLTVCLFDCLQQGATQLGFEDLSTFLGHVELLRWSTTITSNVLAERRGPKIGLIVSKGHQHDLYGAPAESPALNRVIDVQNIVGIGHSNGPEILSAVRSLLESGVRRICISLQGALQNPGEELEIKKTIQEQYPDHFLGSVPALTGSEICQNADDMTRTHCALINAYTHTALYAWIFARASHQPY